MTIIWSNRLLLFNETVRTRRNVSKQGAEPSDDVLQTAGRRSCCFVTCILMKITTAPGWIAQQLKCVNNYGSIYGAGAWWVSRSPSKATRAPQRHHIVLLNLKRRDEETKQRVNLGQVSFQDEGNPLGFVPVCKSPPISSRPVPCVLRREQQQISGAQSTSHSVSCSLLRLCPNSVMRRQRKET